MGSSSRSSSRNFDAGLVVLLLIALAMVDGNGVAVGQQMPACATKLIPCSNFLNSTSPPPDSCCNPLREAVRDDRKCLCNLYSNRQMFNSLGINITQALQLPNHCGITANLTACNDQATATPPSVGNSPPSTTPSGGSGSSNGAAGVAWIGMSCWMGVLLSWASLIG